MTQLCQCGCGEHILDKHHHKYSGKPKFVLGHNKANLGNSHSETTKQLMRDIKLKNPTRYWKGKHHSKATKLKLRLAAIKQIQDGRCAKSSNTDIELIMKSKLKELDLKYVHQYNFNDLFLCDFYIPELQTIVECDGEYWHNFPKTKRKDAYKNIKLKEKYRLLRFSSKMIKNRIEDCISLIFQKEVLFFDWRENFEFRILSTDIDELDKAHSQIMTINQRIKKNA